MNRTIIAALLLLLVVALPVTAGAATVEVTYIGNTGFMVETGGSKILIDAVFDEGFNLYLVPSRSTRNQMRTADGPFKDVDVILVTHWHDDHFDASLVATHLVRNPSCRLIAPPQAVDRLRDIQVFSEIEARVTAVAPGIGESVDVEIRGAIITAVGMRHSPYMLDGADKHRDVQVVGYIVDAGGVTWMHCGDALFDLDESFVESAGLDRRNIDLLFIQAWDRSPRAVAVVNEVIRPEKVIATHIPPSEFDKVAPVFRGEFKGAILFRESMERKRLDIRRTEANN